MIHCVYELSNIQSSLFQLWGQSTYNILIKDLSHSVDVLWGNNFLAVHS